MANMKWRELLWLLEVEVDMWGFGIGITVWLLIVKYYFI
jgi:hypothetical protein